MGLPRNSSLRKSGSFLKRSPLRKRGRKTTLWDDFSAKKAIKDRDEEGLIKCQDWKVGLRRCEIAIPRPDLHHVVGRENAPELYFAESNLVWLTRNCHDAAHGRNTYYTSPKAPHDPKGQVGQEASSSKVLPVQGRLEGTGEGGLGRAIRRDISRTDAEILEQQKKVVI